MGLNGFRDSWIQDTRAFPISQGMVPMETQRCEDKASSAHQISPFLIGKPWENHGKMVIYMERSTIL